MRNWPALLLRSMRPRQWTKNVFLFAALAFDRQLLHRLALERTFAGFLLMCLASGTVYLINDIADRSQDRHHPLKRNRPIASGQLPVSVALVTAVLLAPISLGLAYLLAPAFAALLLGYLALNVAYSFYLKHVAIVDALAVAAGFVLRVGGGVLLIQVVRFSPWLYVCMTLLALFISFGKRRAELALLVDSAADHRPVLDGYTIALLDTYMEIVSAATIVAYSLYTFSAPNLPANHSMMLTTPFVLYGVFRYLYLLEVDKSGGAPEEVLMADRPLQLTIVLWGLCAMVLLYLQT
ncbi:MAG: decaprenyl-phosphate phosphoribosyltransferase [Anaerolineales bacterium]